MKLSPDIQNELNEISPIVAAVPYVNPFHIDNEYFESILPELKARIAADSFYVFASPLTVPEGYFEGLAGNVLQKIREEENNTVDELRRLSPMIAAIGKKNIFTVPVGYFEELKMAAIKETPAKVFKMNPARSVFRYAAAAVITGLLGLSVINIVDKNGIKDSIEQTATVNIQQTANEILKTGSFEKELNTLSDSDIITYLKDNGEDVNAALVATSITDEALLPDASEYLTDENTLDDYLNQNNLKN